MRTPDNRYYAAIATLPAANLLASVSSASLRLWAVLHCEDCPLGDTTLCDTLGWTRRHLRRTCAAAIDAGLIVEVQADSVSPAPDSWSPAPDSTGPLADSWSPFSLPDTSLKSQLVESVVKQLTDFGIEPFLAERLVRHHGPEKCAHYLSAMPRWEQMQDIARPAGFLATAIKQQWSIPNGAIRGRWE